MNKPLGMDYITTRIFVCGGLILGLAERPQKKFVIVMKHY